MTEQGLAAQAQALLDLCRQRNLKIAAAESCTGGLLSATLTEIAGSSDVFERGFITYSNEAKQGMLGISFPEDVGGEGGDLMDTVALQEGMFSAGASSGLMSALFTHGIALPHIAAHGSPDLIDRYVRPTLTGDKIGALGVTEPGGGSDVGIDLFQDAPGESTGFFDEKLGGGR